MKFHRWMNLKGGGSQQLPLRPPNSSQPLRAAAASSLSPISSTARGQRVAASFHAGTLFAYRVLRMHP
jgi:hypothetical protein